MHTISNTPAGTLIYPIAAIAASRDNGFYEAAIIIPEFGLLRLDMSSRTWLESVSASTRTNASICELGWAFVEFVET